jgi:hypothetical protein
LKKNKLIDRELKKKNKNFQINFEIFKYTEIYTLKKVKKIKFLQSKIKKFDIGKNSYINLRLLL